MALKPIKGHILGLTTTRASFFGQLLDQNKVVQDRYQTDEGVRNCSETLPNTNSRTGRMAPKVSSRFRAHSVKQNWTLTSAHPVKKEQRATLRMDKSLCIKPWTSGTLCWSCTQGIMLSSNLRKHPWVFQPPLEIEIQQETTNTPGN